MDRYLLYDSENSKPTANLILVQVTLNLSGQDTSNKGILSLYFNTIIESNLSNDVVETLKIHMVSLVGKIGELIFESNYFGDNVIVIEMEIKTFLTVKDIISNIENYVSDLPFTYIGNIIPSLSSIYELKSKNINISSEVVKDDYRFPSVNLLTDVDLYEIKINREELENNKDTIIKIFLEYEIEITKIRASVGPTIILYELIPSPGVKISRVKNLEDDIILSLAIEGTRIIAPIPGRGSIGIEIPCKVKQFVFLKNVLSSENFQETTMSLPIALGKTISNEVFMADLAKIPHLLIAGASGQGKSIFINVLLLSILYKKDPSKVKFVLIDLKMVELFPYGNLDNSFFALLHGQDEPIITGLREATNAINALSLEMDLRYDLLKKAKVRNIKEYNECFNNNGWDQKEDHRYLPFIILVIDEFSSLILEGGKEIELSIARLAQLARAVGIHLVISTCDVSANIITGLLKAEFPARLAFKVSSKIESHIILDSGGAERLIGNGDMLLSIGSSKIRLQCPFIDTTEVESVISHISSQKVFGDTFFLPKNKESEKVNLKVSDLDDLFDEAADLIVLLC